MSDIHDLVTRGLDDMATDLSLLLDKASKLAKYSETIVYTSGCDRCARLEALLERAIDFQLPPKDGIAQRETDVLDWAEEVNQALLER